jgi:hypothetical protein
MVTVGKMATAPHSNYILYKLDSFRYVTADTLHKCNK